MLKKNTQDAQQRAYVWWVCTYLLGRMIYMEHRRLPCSPGRVPTLIWYHAMTISNLAFFFLPSLLEQIEGRELATPGHWISRHHLPVLWIISNTQSGPEDRLRTNTSWSS